MATNNVWLIFMRNTVNVIITCSLAFIPHELQIGDKLLWWYTPLTCVHLGNLYIEPWFDQNSKAIFKTMINNETMSSDLVSNQHPKSNVLYAAIFTVNMSKFNFRLFELFTIKLFLIHLVRKNFSISRPILGSIRSIRNVNFYPIHITVHSASCTTRL